MIRPKKILNTWLALFLLVGVLGTTSCGKSKALQNKGQEQTGTDQEAPASVDSENPSDMIKSPSNVPKYEFKEGPAILPKADLLAYFEENGNKPVYKVPVVIIRGDRLLEPNKVFIGVEEDTPASDKIVLDTDDSTMGISLEDRIQMTFGEESICHAWLIGQWGSILDLPEFASEKGTYPFTVRMIERRKEGPQSNQKARIWVD